MNEILDNLEGTNLKRFKCQDWPISEWKSQPTKNDVLVQEMILSSV